MFEIKALPFSLQESDRSQACEHVIESGLQTFVDVGNALLEIRQPRRLRPSYGRNRVNVPQEVAQ